MWNLNANRLKELTSLGVIFTMDQSKERPQNRPDRPRDRDQDLFPSKRFRDNRNSYNSSRDGKPSDRFDQRRLDDRSNLKSASDPVPHHNFPTAPRRYNQGDKGPRQQDKGSRQQEKGPRQQDKGPRQQDKGSRQQEKGPRQPDSNKNRGSGNNNRRPNVPKNESANLKRPRDGNRSPNHDFNPNRRKLNSNEYKNKKDHENVPNGPRSSRPDKDRFGPVGNVKPFNRPTEVLNSRRKLGFNDDHSDDEDHSRPSNSRKEFQGKDRNNQQRSRFPPNERNNNNRNNNPNQHPSYSKNQKNKSQPPPPKRGKVYLKVSTASKVPYERILQVGEGTYGKVYKAKNNATGRLVALKRLRLETEKEGFPITAMREINLLQSFQNENISGLLEIMTEQNMIYMIFDYLEHDLTALLSHPAVELNDANRKDLFKQLLTGINYLHEKRIMHRDIKGSNILVDKKGVLKITDFGLARKMKNHKIEESPHYTNRVITLWYRPPELLMGSTDYGREVDMWGIGCLLIELFIKKAAFQGNNEITQLQKIFKIMGTPTFEAWPEMDDLPWYHMVDLEPFPNVFNSVFDKYLLSSKCIELCEGLLLSNPRKRLSAKQALLSSWFSIEPRPERLNLEGLEELHEYEVKKRRRAKQEEQSANNQDVPPLDISQIKETAVSN